MKRYDITLIKLVNHKKKYKVFIFDNYIKDYNILYFGSSKNSDYTIHKNNIKKLNYIKRHYKNENWTDIKTAGFWSRWLLWNLPNINDSIKFIENNFNANIN